MIKKGLLFWAVSIIVLASCSGIGVNNTDQDELITTTAAASANSYKTEGMRLLDVINSKFYDSSTGRYVDSINTGTGAKSSACFLWAAANTIQALTWGSVNDAKYTNRLNAYISALSWYVNGAGYGCTHGGQRFFDDNAITADYLMRAWAYKSRKQKTMDACNIGLNYCFNNKDANWGLPQTEDNLGEGHWYVGPAASQGVAFIIRSKVNGSTTDRDRAVTYWNKINDPVMNIKDPDTLLIKQGVQLVNGVWKASSGPAAGATARAITLGCLLYNKTGNAGYLTAARAIADALLAKWYVQGGGFNAQPQLGGVGSVDALCQMYGASGDVKYKNAARDICDYLMNSCKDSGGYYPTQDLNWNINRHGLKPPATVDLQSQVCAASALLCYAYVDIYGHLPPIQ
jgi:hypothetical protein